MIEWISVKDKLPKKGEVLVFDDGVYEVVDFDGKYFNDRQDEQPGTVLPTHLAKLEPPKNQ